MTKDPDKVDKLVMAAIEAGDIDYAAVMMTAHVLGHDTTDPAVTRTLMEMRQGREWDRVRAKIDKLPGKKKGGGKKAAKANQNGYMHTGGGAPDGEEAGV